MHDDGGQESRLQAALDLTRAIEGHLICLDVVAMPALVGDPLAANASAMLLQDEREREDVNVASLRDRLGREDASWDLSSVVGDLAPAIEDSAALADVIVVNRTLTGSSRHDLRELASELIMRSGKPILAVPEASPCFRPSGRAIVAWDGSAACTAALRAAVPLLQLAESVILLEVDDGALETSARDAAAYLSRHDIHPLIRFEKLLGRSVSDILVSEIRDRRADYMVMGGYGRGRLIETLFGGVTRSLLRQSPVPLFLAR
ncbi:universal stress protein [Sphingobium olei]|uniref:Universal stress protein n=1 Tax=Sphingobium olei TaxID=420955 RepID=A0ABW3NV94_9SPHN